ncbi:MAG: serine/threonine-protein kinase [Gemmatimonadales bacterium]
MTTPDLALFRRAGSHHSNFSTSEELRSTLQRRLYAFGWVIVAYNLSAALFGTLSPVMRARSATAPLSVGSSYFYAGLALLFAVITYLVRSGTPRTLTFLRIYEASLFTVGEVLFLALNAYDYSTLQGIYEKAPIDIALGMASFSAFQMIAYGVLIPNPARRVAVAMVLITLAAFVPDVWALNAGLLPVSIAGIVFGFKAVSLSLTGFIIWFGSYRFETVARREAAARELGQYVLGERLGSGGMGEVYRGEHRMLRRPVAIKLISADQAGSAEALARFEREAQATAQLTHPNTVQLFDYGRSDDGTFYCVMELLNGETLEQIVARDGPMDVARAVHVLQQLCGALAEAHDRGLIHRDIKPSNVILGDRGGMPDVAKLLDFGLVTERGAGSTSVTLTQAGSIVGTPEFMSPEQCGEPDEIGQSSDIYSLGALGYFLVAGRSPFAGRNAVQLMAAHLYEVPAPPSTYVEHIPEELAALLMRALAKNPAERFEDARAMASALSCVVPATTGSNS